MLPLMRFPVMRYFVEFASAGRLFALCSVQILEPSAPSCRWASVALGVPCAESVEGNAADVVSGNMFPSAFRCHADGLLGSNWNKTRGT